VAGTVGAKDNTSGVVGVAPGVRLWAVKILDDTGFGYLSWYVCGLDWIASQRDPADPTRPLIEAVNMSVAKWGADDGNCGVTNKDVLHQAICRVTRAGVTVVAAAANDAGSAASRVPAAYNEVITVSALADTDGKAGGLGGARCHSWGGYDVDDTFADFSNYGADVDIIAPGKCIWSTLPGNRYGYSSGTSMAAPAVTGAAALFLASRKWPRPGEVKGALQALGNLNWRTSTDPDASHERLLDVSRLAAGGDYGVRLGPAGAVTEAGGIVKIPVNIDRTATHFETVNLTATSPAGMPVSLSTPSLTGFTAVQATVTVVVPRALTGVRYPIKVTATQGSRVREATTDIVVESDVPVARAPSASPAYDYSMKGTRAPVRVLWPAATDPSTWIAGYEVQHSMDWGAWGPSVAVGGTARNTVIHVESNHSHRFRLRARDAAGHWSAWVTSRSLRLGAVDDQATAMRYSSGWSDADMAAAYLRKVSRTGTNGATVTLSTAGRTLAVVSEVGPTNGWLDITVNNVLQRRISLWASQPAAARVLWIKDFGTDAPLRLHLRAVVSGSRNRANVDAVLVGR
jgi:subtilisin family serine protease